MNSAMCFLIGLIILLDLTLTEPRPTETSMVYDIFELSENNCSQTIGKDLNSTLYETCSRKLPDIEKARDDPLLSSVLNEVLKCVSALYSLKYSYCKTHRDNTALTTSLSNYSSLKLSEFCGKGENHDYLEPALNPVVVDWIILLKSKLSLEKNCSQLCYNSGNPQGVDYFCVLASKAGQFNVKATAASSDVAKSNEVSEHSKKQFSQTERLAHDSPPTSNEEVKTPVVTSEQRPVPAPVDTSSVKAKETPLKTSKTPENEPSLEQTEFQHFEEPTEQKSGNNEKTVPTNEDINRDNNEFGSDKVIQKIPTGEEPSPEEPLIDQNDSGGIEDKIINKPSNDRMTAEYASKDFRVEEASNFFFYFIFMVVMTAFGYMAFHNKNKLIALVVEGRRSRSRSRSGGRHSSTSYSKLHSNLEETMTASSAPSSTHVLY